ncbi:MAG: hypothetical protein ACHQ6U_00290 [Thermodesulfobacteriota bacterium]
MPGNKAVKTIISNIIITISTLFLLSFLIMNVSVQAAQPSDLMLESPKRVLVVKDYKWASGGMGGPAIMKEITLQNIGKYDYENIAIEVDLYTNNDIPLGSVRGTIHDVLSHGSEKTFYNVNFGIMSAELQHTVARIANADLIEKSAPFQAKDLILVKDWEWSGGAYGTEGILKSITLVNKSSENWRDIKIRVDFLGIPSAKVGVRGFTSRATIHDTLPAKSERTYHDVNVGFRHPDARNVDISVMSARPISEKELKIKTAKATGKKAVKKKKKKAVVPQEGTTPGTETRGGAVPESQKELSLSERYKQKLAKQKGETVEGTTGETGAQAASEKTAQGAEPAKEATTGAGSEQAAQGEQAQGKGEEGEEYEYEEEAPVPDEDIQVADFKWGGGVTGTIGIIDEITLQNSSDITYTNIELKIEFYSFKEGTPMFSNKAFIKDVLPANSKKTFRNIKAGYLNAIPQEVKIDVITAVPFNR